MHYATRMKNEIKELVESNNNYYRAIRNAKERAGIDCGVSGLADMCDNEELITCNDKDALFKIIEDLPVV